MQLKWSNKVETGFGVMSFKDSKGVEDFSDFSVLNGCVTLQRGDEGAAYQHKRAMSGQRGSQTEEGPRPG